MGEGTAKWHSKRRLRATERNRKIATLREAHHYFGELGPPLVSRLCLGTTKGKRQRRAMCGDDVNHIPSSFATTTLGLDSRGLGLCDYNYTAPAHGSFVSPTSSRSPRPLRNAFPENVKKRINKWGRCAPSTAQRSPLTKRSPYDVKPKPRKRTLWSNFDVFESQKNQ